MPFYDNFVKTNKTPREKWKDGLQEFVNKEFDNASTFYEDVEEEIEFGTLEFRHILVRINSLVDAKTGQRANDDYKKIIFSDLDYKVPIGTRYRFDNNIWLVFSTDNIKTDTSSVYVRRCNNTMNWQDKYGNIHREPCYIDYKLTENQIFREYSVDVPSGRIWVQYQANDKTRDININSRFIFGTNPYKVRSMGDYDRLNTFDQNSARLLSFYADYDNKAEDDNFELSVANYKCFTFTIDSEDIISNTIGYKNSLIYNVYLNNSIVENENVSWESTDSNIAEIDKEGNYVFKNLGTCMFIGKMDNNPSVEKRITVLCKEEVSDSYYDYIQNKIDYIPLNKTERYSIYEYKNGEMINTKYDIACEGVPEYCYSFTSDGNNFSITNKKPCYDSLLKVSYKNNRNGVTKFILLELGGII